MDVPQTSQIVDHWLNRAQAGGEPPELCLKRGAPRYFSDDHFVLRPVLDDFPETPAKGHNISASGLGVISRRPIPRDYFVLVRLDESDGAETWVPATVIHCTQTIGGYKVGLQFRYEDG